jgi:hypothetical protein
MNSKSSSVRGRPVSKAQTTSGLCNHGLNDGLQMITEMSVKNYETREITTSYRYWCQEHGHYGTFCVKRSF